MANKDLLPEPHNLEDPDTYWYEEIEGITIFCDDRVIDITWEELRAALKRKDKHD